MRNETIPNGTTASGRTTGDYLLRAVGIALADDAAARDEVAVAVEGVLSAYAGVYVSREEIAAALSEAAGSVIRGQVA